MALTPEQKRQIVRSLADGKTVETAAALAKCSAASIYRFKKTADYQILRESISVAVVASAVSKEADILTQRLSQISDREPWIREQTFARLEQLNQVIGEALETIHPDDVGIRQIPSLISSFKELANVYVVLDDRLTGIDILASEIEQMRKINGSTEASGKR
ncbi:MAG: hypothetical protein AAFY17_10290 [Cyanobacteria bacterium J06642_11]